MTGVQHERALDIEAIRSNFAFLELQPYGKPIIYFDNAASAQKPNVVVDRLSHFYKFEYANVHRGLHYLANQATEAYEDARVKVQKFINAADAEEIIFTRGATEAMNIVAASFGLDRLSTGDEIILSTMEHHSNIVPWHFLRERKGAVIKWIEVGPDGLINPENVEQLITKRTKIIAITHMSNVLGAEVPCVHSWSVSSRPP